MIAGFLGFLTIFIDTVWTVKAIAIGGFINCFFSAVPYLSFTSYVSLIGCCYFYIACSRIEDWNWIFKALQAILFLNMFLLIMAVLKYDPLMNFNAQHIQQYGVIGNHMMMGSFAVILSAILISFNRINILFPFIVSLVCVSTWAFFAAAVGLAVTLVPKSTRWAVVVLSCLTLAFMAFAVKETKFSANLDNSSGRMGVWKRSVELAFSRPVTGWGIGTYKDVFAPISGMTCNPWRTAHSFIVQMAFEVGFPLTILITASLCMLMVWLWRAGLYLQLAGLSMMVVDALVHFPDRMIQCVPLIILFLAYCEFRLRRVQI